MGREVHLKKFKRTNHNLAKNRFFAYHYGYRPLTDKSTFLDYKLGYKITGRELDEETIKRRIKRLEKLRRGT